eukprot:CAMPEP_0118701588 /NCGR_PEP_ID=MMETSP0800-20121206/17346_1 /TAXON_ID=210618 ORGANISM="Striatella unipunctata, Strain CCMP2910" /NCGR_SAMPLE_ID=MMETSP0800 /ASSEMBLY_ACC=CAM_ASM_000638 /LENGTH=77 /DNA_ID=CAMNT_0006602549 /DNA_START=92 /DNA_END=325 /DNA_ORIENTATION=-
MKCKNDDATNDTTNHNNHDASMVFFKSQSASAASAVDEKFIVRPEFAIGKEVLVYSNKNVIYSNPDVTYRTSVMQFM